MGISPSFPRETVPNETLNGMSHSAHLLASSFLGRCCCILGLLLSVCHCTPALPSPAPTSQEAVVAPATLEPRSAAVVEAEDTVVEQPETSQWLTTEFGGARWGFVEASSANGRLVLLRRFIGAEQPSFGIHGDSGPTELTLFDLQTDQTRPVEDWISVDSTRRWFLLLAEGLQIVDSQTGQWSALSDADLTSDGNVCLPPRMAEFAPSAARVAWVLEGNRRAKVRDLTDNTEWEIASPKRIWRVVPDDAGRGATLIEVDAGSTAFPEQRTSCACRHCIRFAMSYGLYGFGGPPFDLAHVDDSGARTDVAEIQPGEYAVHGATTEGCQMQDSQQDNDALQFGPWKWSCNQPPNPETTEE